MVSEAGQDDRIAVRIAYPVFPVVWSTVAVRWVAVARHDDLNLHRLGTCQGSVKIVDLKPEQDPVAVRLGLGITDGAMMVLDIPSVQLKDQLAPYLKTLILRPAMGTLTAEQALIPPAACLNVIHAKERLWMHVHAFWD